MGNREKMRMLQFEELPQQTNIYFGGTKMGYRDTLMITYLNHPIPRGVSQHEVYSSEPHKLKAMM